MSNDSLAAYVAKPATAFAIGAGIASYAHPDVALTIMGTNVPMWVVGGSLAAIFTEVGTLFNEYAAPHITSLTALNAPIHTAANIGISAGGTALAYQAIAGAGWNETIGLPELLVAATIVEVGSGYLTETWFKPMLESHGY